MNKETEAEAGAFCGWLDRPIGRWTYFWQGFVLVLAKYNLDRLVAWAGFHRSWVAWNYIEPARHAAIDSVTPDDRGFYLALVLTSLPFVFLGITLTLKRLRSAGLPRALCLLFFAPVANVVFFLALSAVPPRREITSSPADIPPPKDWGWLTGALGSIAIVGTIGVVLVILAVKGLHNYGWGLFVALPFALGLASSLIYGHSRPRDLSSSLGVAVLPLLFVGVALIGIAFEGLVCIVMASPIAAALALLGGLIGHSIQNSRHAGISRRVAAVVLAATPLFMGMESRANLEAPLLRITSAVDIDASPEKVWPTVVAFPEISERREWLFRTGIAYPTHAEIDGRGIGAVRHCVFSTGQFVEPIEVWDEPRLLKFSVADQPEPLEELTPYPRIHPAHLHGYMVSKEGQLKLIPLAGGRTRLEGTTWYTNRIWPVAYWQVWTDFIIHRIHLRVLNHIKAVAEGREAAS